jgi:hypothetical protein
MFSKSRSIGRCLLFLCFIARFSLRRTIKKPSRQRRLKTLSWINQFRKLNDIQYAFLDGRRSHYFRALSWPTGHLMREIAGRSTMEKRIIFSPALAFRTTSTDVTRGDIFAQSCVDSGIMRPQITQRQSSTTISTCASQYDLPSNSTPNSSQRPERCEKSPLSLPNPWICHSIIRIYSCNSVGPAEKDMCGRDVESAISNTVMSSIWKSVDPGKNISRLVRGRSCNCWNFHCSHLKH